MFSTTEITSHEETSDNVIHQRLLFAYLKAAEYLSGNVLEIGCGAGRGLETVLSYSERYTAIDKNEALLNHLQKKYPNATFKAQHIPPLQGIADNAFDWVISFQVIEHIPDDHLFLKEIYRVLKPGGKAIITTPNIKLSLTRNPWHIREYTVDELYKLCSKYFNSVEIEGVTGSEPVMEYYERNKESVRKITRFDIFNLQYRLPRAVLQIPYDLLNRLNRKSLMNGNDTLVSGITTADYSLTAHADKAFDLFCILQK